MDQNIDRYRTVGENPKSYAEMLLATKEALQYQSKYEQQRLLLAQDICGKLDGLASERIVQSIRDILGK